MSMAAIVAWVMFSVLIAWIGTVLYATFRTLDGEVRDASERRGDERSSPGDP
jgi:hypothetical protein